MGKWEAMQKDPNSDKYWVTKEGVDNWFSKDQATRYALALNIVDAGVDLGEAVKELLAMWNTRTSDEERIPIAIEMAHFLNSILIANAVEGDTTKEDV